jgi:SAM-dependent methyltransferase
MESVTMRACDVCGARRSKRWFVKHGCTLLRCTECGFVYMDRPPGQAGALEQLYRDPAYFGGGGHYLDYLGHEPHHRLLARRILDAVGERHRVATWLDVGCAAGFLLDEARQRGIRVRGLDLSEAMVRRAVALGLDARV